MDTWNDYHWKERPRAVFAFKIKRKCFNKSLTKCPRHCLFHSKVYFCSWLPVWTYFCKTTLDFNNKRFCINVELVEINYMVNLNLSSFDVICSVNPRTFVCSYKNTHKSSGVKLNDLQKVSTLIVQILYLSASKKYPQSSQSMD